MPGVHAAVVPHPPLLAAGLTGLGTGAAQAAVPVREAVTGAVRDLLGTGPPAVVCVGGGMRTRRHPADEAWGTLAGYGLGIEAPPGHGPGPATLPLSLTIGRLLLHDAGWRGPLVLQEVAADEAPGVCAGLGAVLAADLPRAGWLVLGDAGATRASVTPEALDERAEGFDRAVARALGDADARALAALDPALAAALGAQGRAAWQVLAGGASACREPASGTLLLDAAPFGVAYLVASWRPAGRRAAPSGAVVPAPGLGH